MAKIAEAMAKDMKKFYEKKENRGYRAVIRAHRTAQENQRLKARVAELEGALKYIAEDMDAGRHDGLPESAPAHEDYVMWVTAKEALQKEQDDDR